MDKIAMEQAVCRFNEELAEFKTKVFRIFRSLEEANKGEPVDIDWRMFFIRNRTGYITFHKDVGILNIDLGQPYAYGVIQVDSHMQDCTEYTVTFWGNKYNLEQLVDMGGFTAEGADFYVW